MYKAGDTVKVVESFNGSYRVNITSAMRKHLGKRLVIKGNVLGGYVVYESDNIWEESMFLKKVKVSKRYKLGERFKCIETLPSLDIFEGKCFEIVRIYEDGTYVLKISF